VDELTGSLKNLESIVQGKSNSLRMVEDGKSQKLDMVDFADGI
jgi:hypothetical protein